MNEAKIIVKYGRIYTIADLINRAAGLILIPLYTYILSLSDYGIYALVSSVTDVLTIVIGMGMVSAMNRFYFDFPESSKRRNALVSTTLIGFFGFGMLLIICSYPLSQFIVEILFGSTEHVEIFALAICGVLFIVFLEIEMSFFLIQKQATLYLIVSIGKALFLLGTNALFFFYLKMGVLGIVISTLTSFALLSIVAGVYIFWKVGFGFSFDIFKQLLSFGIPLILSAITGTGTQLIQRYYLNALAGPAAVGIIALASRLAFLLQMFAVAPFFKIFFVRRLETLAGGKNQSDLNQILLIFLGAVSAGGLFLGLFGSEIIYIISPDGYKNAALYVPLLCLIVMISVIEKNFGLGLLYQKKTKVIATIAIVSLLASVPSNYFLILHFGPMGAVLAYLLIHIVGLAMVVKTNGQMGVPQIQLDWVRAIIILALVSSISAFGYQYWANTITIPLIIFKVGLFGFFIVSLVVSPLLDSQSRKIIISFLKGKAIKV